MRTVKFPRFFAGHVQERVGAQILRDLDFAGTVPLPDFGDGNVLGPDAEFDGAPARRMRAELTAALAPVA